MRIRRLIDQELTWKIDDAFSVMQSKMGDIYTINVVPL